MAKLNSQNILGATRMDKSYNPNMDLKVPSFLSR